MCSFDKLKTLYLHSLKHYGSQTWLSGDLSWEDPTHQVTWTFDHLFTEKNSNVLSTLYFVFYLAYVMLSMNFDVLIRCSIESHSIHLYTEICVQI